MDEYGFQRHISELSRAKKLARDILGVEQGASESKIKRAWRRECRKHHPDRNDADNAEAADRFHLARLAYRCLAEGEDCRRLLEEGSGVQGAAGRLVSDRWSYFLWWRENFF